MITRDKFVQFLMKTQLILPQGAPNTDNPEVQEAWYEALGHHELDTIRKVYLICRVRCDKFPTIRQIEEFIDEINVPIARDPFTEIIAKLKKYGSTPSNWPPQDDVIGRILNRTGGLPRYALVTEANYEWLRKEVMATWKEILQYKRSGFYETDKLPRYMCGVEIIQCTYQEALTGNLDRDKIKQITAPPIDETPKGYFQGGLTEERKNKWDELKSFLSSKSKPSKHPNPLKAIDIDDIKEQLAKTMEPSPTSSKRSLNILSSTLRCIPGGCQ